MLQKPFGELAGLAEAPRLLGTGRPVSLSGCADAAKAHLIAGLVRETGAGAALVVTYSDQRARQLRENLAALTGDAVLYPARDLLFFSADVHGNALTIARQSALRRLLREGTGLIVTTVLGLMDPLMPAAQARDLGIVLKNGDVLDLAETRKELERCGYELVGRVEEPGHYAVRGGILDVFPITGDSPVRVELWGDEIDSIRFFDVQSQRSVENLQEIRIEPAAELIVTDEEREAGTAALRKEYEKQKERLLKSAKGAEGREAAARLAAGVGELAEGLSEGWIRRVPENCIGYYKKQTESLLSYFPAGSPVFLDEPDRLWESASAAHEEFRVSMEGRLLSGQVLPRQAGLLRTPAETFGLLENVPFCSLTGLDAKLRHLPETARFPLDAQAAPSYQDHFEELIRDLQTWKKKKFRVVLLSPSRTRTARLAQDLREYELAVRFGETGEEEIGPGEVLVTQGGLSAGFSYPAIRFVVLTEGDLFGAQRRKKKRHTQYEGTSIGDFSELSVGDYVVHEQHGLGIYQGIEKVTTRGMTQDYLKISYANNASLYTPVTQLSMVQKYAGAGARAPKLSRLGSAEWQKTKSRVKAAVKDIAADLVRLYAARQEMAGYAFGPDTVWQREFEELFPYEETEDQKRAIDDTKADMESRKIMDRLICGDVGYGKTEIALRAAFKAVQESKQVVMLVPTTILAQQHYHTFLQRMKGYPVEIALLSRFQTAGEQKKILEDVKKGFVDILIGTHRVLSKDVVYKDLGLLIIDEEQRFGVSHKEKIKRLRTNVDVLTLSATPIPRTLHMSLAGIRDMSVLTEPPQDRVPIQTYVMEYSDEMVREAIRREMGRGGQVYYVYNRVRDIADVTGRIAALIPEARVVCAHGQMAERELERIMLDFMNGEIDVLVSTTIIETGLDISNVNTIIVHDADRYGLSQLYQLRGRVGRADRTAYAFLMYRRDKLLKEVAEKRLQAIREYTDLGSGIRIAMRDLEIRGAGNILGAEQHGHMEAVGYELYCKLLNEAVRVMRGEKTEQEREPARVDLSIDAFLPVTYVRNEALKLEVYKRIAAIGSPEELADMQDELIDRFGDIPEAAQNLLRTALLRAKAEEADVREITGSLAGAQLVMQPRARIHVEKIPEVLAAFGESLVFRTAGDPAFVLVGPRGGFANAGALLDEVSRVLEKIASIRFEEGEEP
ncbi:MAG: transcription-repair coupling factor [Lachnospiraceae bacterium]|nr:transcription-repair coupling factor [Lachnospiraceae bacterium]